MTKMSDPIFMKGMRHCNCRVPVTVNLVDLDKASYWSREDTFLSRQE